MDPFRKKMLLLLIGHQDPESAIEDQGENEDQESSGIAQGPQSLRKANQEPDYIVRKKKKGGM